MTVATADAKGAGTDSNVFVNIYGTYNGKLINRWSPYPLHGPVPPVGHAMAALWFVCAYMHLCMWVYMHV